MPSATADRALFLEELTRVEEGGAKALALARLARAGLPVPDAFVLPPDHRDVPARRLLAALGGRLMSGSLPTGGLCVPLTMLSLLYNENVR